jgi:nucleotide-binding universal stress UspA family protein
MIEIRRILCPIDFSDFSRRAVNHAVAIAAWYESTVTLFHIAPVDPVVIEVPDGGLLRSGAHKQIDVAALQAAMQQFAERTVGGRVPVECELAHGSTAAEILAKAETLPADLLVVGTHGRSGFERLMLGSVTEKVLRKAACPVMTVPRSSADPDTDPSLLFKRILCAIDFTESSMHALRHALSIAQEADATLTVVHVIEVPADGHEQGLAMPGLDGYVARAEEAARARLSSAIPEDVRAYCTIDTVMPTGKPYREILRVADERKANLLVIGVHGRGVVDRMLFGSTAQQLVRMASCPVLTLRKG